jgi:ABC-type ATPase involved in cell division
MIITLDLCLRRGGISVIDGLNMHIEQGEFAFICGQAGAGKTSLLRVFALQMVPTEGRVIIDGVDIAGIGQNGLARYRCKLGIIFPELRLLPRRTLAENIHISLKLAGWHWADVRKETDKYLREVGLGGKANLLPEEISENERQLLKVCRALARRPKIILADEPYEGLDWQSIEKVVYLLRRAHLRGSTVVVATHHVEFAEQLGKRLIMLDRRSLGMKAKTSGVR